MNIFTLMGTIFVDYSKAEESISKTGKSAEGLASKLGTGLKTAASIGATAMIAIGTAAAGMAFKAVTASDDCQKALNSLQVQTGATAQEMNGLKDSLLSIYSNNYGESFEDVAQALANVKQQTGLAGQELEGFTTNALALRDIFEYEVTESTRAADMMMKQFGITADEAFNLIAQGAQNGLDKNDNLLDSINEYAVHFAQIGLDAEDMFNMFSNGAETGVFDVDKLGDAVKEFGIRAKDASDSTMGAFESLGLDAEELTQKFANGGAEAEAAFMQVNTALMNCDNKVLQNQAGVALWGTMWEDMGAGAVAALVNVNGEFDKTKATMDALKEVKYDSLGEAFAGIGRQLETGLLIPLGDKLLPYLNDFANWINEHMPEIQSICETVMAAIGSAIDSIGGFTSGAIESLNDFKAKNSELFEAIKVIWDSVKLLFTETCESIKSIVSAFLNTLQAFWNTWGSTITAYIASTLDQLRIIFDTTFNVIIDLLNIFTAAFNGDWGAMWEAVKQLASDIWDGITALLKSWLDSLVNAILAEGSSMLNAGKNIFNQFLNGSKNVWQLFISWLNQVKKAPVTAITGLASSMLSAGKSIFTSLLNGVKSAWTSVQSYVTEKVNWLKDKVTFWNSSSSKMSTNGSHAGGINNIPYDGYIAELHKGERVLTASENNALNSQNNTSSSVAPQINIVMNYPQVDSLKNIKTISRQLKEQITQGDRALGLV